MVDSNTEIEAYTQPYIRKNWVHFHIWPAINQTEWKINFFP